MNFHDNDLVPIDATRRRARSHREGVQEGAEGQRPGRADGDDQPVFRSRSSRTARSRPTTPDDSRLCDPEDDARDGPGPRDRREDLRLLGRPRGRRVDATKNPVEAIKRFREAINFLCEYCARQEVRTTSSRSRPSPTSRAATCISDDGRVPRVHPDARSSRDVRREPRSRPRAHGRAELLSTTSRRRIEVGKLFHIDLNDQEFGRYDQDFRFGSEPSSALLPGQAARGPGYNGPRHFDAHAVSDRGSGRRVGVRAGCMRTYMILKEKAKQFNADAEIQALLKELADTQARSRCRKYSTRRRERAQGALVRPRRDRPKRLAVRAAGSAGDRSAAGRAVGAESRAWGVNWHHNGERTTEGCDSARTNACTAQKRGERLPHHLGS